jgi:hypothetical protein
MYTNSNPAEWIRQCVKDESEGSITPAQLSTSVLLEPDTARAIGLTGIWRMTKEEVEQALAAEECI